MRRGSCGVLLLCSRLAGAAEPSLERPLSLADCLHLAEADEPTAQAFQARIAAARAQVVTQGNWPNPVLSYLAQDIGLREGDRSLLLQQQLVAFPMLFGYIRGLQVAVARAQQARVEAQVVEERRRRALTVGTAYFELRALQDLLVVEGRAIAAAEELLAISLRRHATGDVGRLEVVRAEAERAEAERSEALLRQRRNIQALGLSILLGAKQPVAVELRRESTEEALAGAGSGELAKAWAERPELVRAAAERREAELLVQLEQRRVVPLAELTVAGGVRQSGAGLSGVVSASLPLPLFDHNRGPRLRAQAQLQAARAGEAEARRQVALSVASAQLEQQSTEEMLVGIQRPLVARRAEILRSLRRQFAEGSMSYLEVVTAQRDLLAAERQLALSERDAALGRLRLWLEQPP